MCFFFSEKGFLHSFRMCPGTHCIDEAGLQLTDIHLPLSPECWGKRHAQSLPGTEISFLLLNISHFSHLSDGLHAYRIPSLFYNQNINR